jgi:cytochrome c oxidase assembly protein subunit 15
MNSATNGSINHASRALHRFAIVCATATFILIFVGGLVTSTGSALAVPDWPLAYGRLVPKLVGGVRFEYGHRVVAGVVVMLTIILSFWTALVERRSWVRKTAFAAAAIIVVQAILGGITVLYLLPLPVAVAHAGTAQALVCVMVAMALFTNPEFGTGTPLDDDAGRPRLATLAMITTAVIYAQILIGAVMRHLGAGLAIPDFPSSFGHLTPPFISLAIDVNFAHRCGAVAVSMLVLWTVTLIFRRYRHRPELTRPALLLIVLLLTQVTLGALTIWSGRAVLPTTTHVAIGAAVLATSLALTIRIRALGGLAWRAEAAKVRAPISPSMERKVTV